MATKKIRMQSQKIDVPEENPFENDLLNRKVPAEALTSLVDAIEGPCVLAVDAGWGTGKTTFLDMWAQHLRDEKFSVLRFNAWETDFSDDPFVAFASELIESLEIDKIDIAGLKKITKELITYSSVAAIRHVTAGYVDLEELKKISSNPLFGERLNAHRKAKNLVQNFKTILQKTAQASSEKVLELSKEAQASSEEAWSLPEEEKHPLIVMVDELDRCRPSYAVEFLEVTKHLFSVDHIVFVLAVNRSELAHSVKAIYGSKFDAKEYLGRFFDVDFRLPQPKRDAFINALIGTEHKLNLTQADFLLVATMLREFLDDPELSLRQVEQAINRFNWVFASLHNDRDQFYLDATMVVILRTVNPELYGRFIRGDASDLDVAEGIFKRPGLKTAKYTRSGCLFQALLIAAMRDSPVYQITDSPLTQQIQERVQSNKLDATSPENNILHLANNLSGRNSFQIAVRCIELFSEGFLDARTE